MSSSVRTPRIQLILLLLGALVALAGCSTPPEDRRFNPYAKMSESTDEIFVPVNQTNQPNRDLLARPKDIFRLGPGDVIEIRILGDDRSATKTLVGPDGKIYFNLLRATFVWGLTLSEATDLIERQLSREFQVPPRVSIMLRSVGSRKVWIMGQVQSPGLYDLVIPMTVLEALSSAGGLASPPNSSQINADLKNSFLIRGDRRIEVDFEKLVNQGDFSQNIYLQPDDFLFLAPGQASDVYVMGAVAHPGNYPLNEQMRLTRALANAGGLAKYSFGTHVAVIRGTLNNPRIAIVDFKAIERGRAMDLLLQAGDLVYVPFAPYRKLAELFDQALNQFVSSIAINEGRNAVQRGSAPVGVSVGLGGSVGPVTP